MKKLFTTILCVTVFAAGAFAQHCATATTSIAPKPASGTPGLTPTPANLPCGIDSGTFNTDTIYFENYSSFAVGGNTVTLNSLKIDSINNLPEGLCWETNVANNTFTTGQTGVIYVSGNCTAAPGQYKLKLIVDIKAGPGNVITYNNADAEVLTGTLTGSPLRYYVRVRRPSCGCFGIDSVGGATHYFTDDSVPVGCKKGVGINDISSELSAVSVTPNPFSNTAKLTFSSEAAGKYTVRMMNLLGSEVMNKEVSANSGNNEVTIERNNLTSGIYLISLSNRSGTITRKVIIE